MSPRRAKIVKWSLVAITLCTLTISNLGTASSLRDLARGLNIKKEAISVSGISSGAFMAHQFHVAHSEHIMGVGIIAGGPYYCAKGSIVDAVTRCSKFVALSCGKLLKLFSLEAGRCGDRTPNNETEIKQMAQASFDEARKKNTLKNIKEDRIYIFSGQHDGIVPHSVMDAVFDFYADPNKVGVKKENINYNREFPAQHTMVRDSFDKPSGEVIGNCILPPAPPPPPEKNSFIDDCQEVAQEYKASNGCVCPTPTSLEPPTKSACPPSDKIEICEDAEDVDLAGAILAHIYGEEALKAGRLIMEEEEVQPFDQSQIFKRFSRTPLTALQLASMAKVGYVFIPETCNDGRECKLHVAFHGCLQGGKTDKRPGHSGNLFSKYAGYNQWAKANDIVVLYPQVESRNVPPPVNPQGCWDWWGQDYTHENYHTKHGTQIKAVAQMINVLVGGKEDVLDIPAD
jgi:poly(3-hydroxybutyrate) depolymerase